MQKVLTSDYHTAYNRLPCCILGLFRSLQDDTNILHELTCHEDANFQNGMAIGTLPKLQT